MANPETCLKCGSRDMYLGVCRSCEGFKGDEDAVRWRDCPECNGRGWFLINPFETGGRNGAGGIGNMRQCPRCKSEYEKHQSATSAA